MRTHDTVIRVDHRPQWQQRVPLPIDHPEVQRRMRDLAAHWIMAEHGPSHVVVSAQWKGFSRTLSASRGVLWG